MTDTEESAKQEIEANKDLLPKIYKNSLDDIKTYVQLYERPLSATKKVTLGALHQTRLIDSMVNDFGTKTENGGISAEASRFSSLTDETQRAFAKSVLIHALGNISRENQPRGLAGFALQG